MNALVAISKGMQAVKLCTNKILQFLTVADFDLYNGHKMVVVVVGCMNTFTSLSVQFNRILSHT